MFQKVNDWLSDHGGRFFRSGEAGHNAGGAYYASQEAEQAYGGMGAAAQDTDGDTARTAAADTMNAEGNDPYGGRVPYRSQKQMQADAEQQRRREAEEQARQQQAAYQQQQQTQAYPQAAASAAYQQPSNILPFPGMIRGPEGNLYAHVEYIVLLRSRNECTRIIEYIKANASVFLNMEFIANDSERQRCVDMLSGAAYTLGCRLNKISQRGVYLISSPSVYVVLDPAMQKYAASADAQNYVRPEYAGYQQQPFNNPQAFAFAAQPTAGFPGQQPMGFAPQPAPGYGMDARQTGAYQAQHGMGYAAARQTGYADQPAANAGYAPRQAEFAAAPRQNAAFGLGAQANAYRQPTETEYPQEQNTAYVAGARPENVPQRRRTAAYNL